VSVALPAAGRSVPTPVRLPAWLTTRPPKGPGYQSVRDTVAELGLATVCREARCPNLSECWSAQTATIMLLGSDCSRRCGFCAVNTRWGRGAVDPTEPARVAEGVRRWGLRYVVLTQVCRDDLEDGGASVLSQTVAEIRARSPSTLVELLIGDLGGSRDALAEVLLHPPEVLAHNLETVRELSPAVRDHRASYERSLTVLRTAKEVGGPELITKSSLMLGLGETRAQLDVAFGDLRGARVDLLTLGQYLRPGAEFLPVQRFVPPEEFAELGKAALTSGFAGVEAGPLVRSSYHAEELFHQASTRPGE